MADSSPAVFLSYASEDAEPARRICDALRSAGLQVWFDQNELQGGDAWDAEIRRRIKTCTLFMPVISGHTEGRPEGYFRLEWKLAVDRSQMMSQDHPFLLPVAIDATPESSLRVPERFREVQWYRFSQPGDGRTLAERAMRLLGGSVGGPALSVAAPHDAAASADTTPSIAVLPFANMSRDEENEYFADGLTEELLNVLANIRGLRVASRTSAFFFKGKGADLATVARKLNVANILEGSVRKSGSRVRITVQLIEAGTDSHLWSKTYDRQLDDIFAVQDDIAQAVVAELRQSLLPTAAEMRAATSGRTLNAEAHELFLRGKHLVNRDQAELARGVELLKRAVELDPGFAIAWTWLSAAYFLQAGNAWVPPAEGFRLAEEAARRALDLAPDLPDGYVALARVLLGRGRDWAAADAALRRAYEIAPRSDLVLRALSRHAGWSGRLEEATALLLQSMEIDPLNFATHLLLGNRYAELGRFEDAEKSLKTGLDLNPATATAHLSMTRLRLLQGRAAEALEEARQEVMVHLRVFATALAEYSLGNQARADEALAELIRDHSRNGPYNIASVYAWRGDRDKAFEWLDRAREHGDFDLLIAATDPFLNSLRSDPRWTPFLASLGMPATFADQLAVSASASGFG